MLNLHQLLLCNCSSGKQRILSMILILNNCLNECIIVMNLIFLVSFLSLCHDAEQKQLK